MTENHEQQPGDGATDKQGKCPKGRRGRRKTKYVVGALVVALIAVLGFGAVAKYHYHANWHEGGFEAFVDHRVDKMLDRIDASDEQRAKVKPILMAASGDMRALYLEMRESRRSLVTALTGADVDRQSIESLRAARMASMDQASERVLRALADVAEILTPAQRAEIAEKLARHDHYDD